MYEASADNQSLQLQETDELETNINPIEFNPLYPVYRFNVVDVILASKQNLSESTTTVSTIVSTDL